MKKEFFDAIRSKFDIKVEEKHTIDFLGMTLSSDRVNKSVRISQRNYVEKLVKTFGVTKTLSLDLMQSVALATARPEDVQILRVIPLLVCLSF